MQTIDYQPRLSPWSHVWRYLLAIALGLAGWIELGIWQWKNDRPWFFLDLAVGAGCLVLAAWRRRHPVRIALVTAAATAVSGFGAGAATLALVSLSTRRRRREIIPVAVANVGAALVLEWVNPTSQDDPIITWPIILAAIVITIGWGMYIGSRRELLATLRERADTAESEQSARVAQARTAERSRIAREMHDVLAHRISLVTMHAGALAYRHDLTSEEVRSTAAVIQDNSHQALVELREVLGILRDEPGDAAPEVPQPSATDLQGLIDEARTSSLRVEIECDISLEGIPEMLGRTLYRVVQEGLTNARKHAPDTRVVVTLGGNPADGLTIEVCNPLRIGTTWNVVPESGLGLVGLSERAALAGGQLSHRVTAEREFILEAWLPWPT